MVKHLDQPNETRVFEYNGKKKNINTKISKQIKQIKGIVGLEPTIQSIKNKRLNHLAIPL